MYDCAADADTLEWLVVSDARNESYQAFDEAVADSVFDAIRTDDVVWFEEYCNGNRAWTIAVRVYAHPEPVENPPPPFAAERVGQTEFGVYHPATHEEEFFDDLDTVIARAAFLSGFHGGAEVLWRKYTGDAQGGWQWGPLFGITMYQVAPAAAANPWVGERPPDFIVEDMVWQARPGGPLERWNIPCNPGQKLTRAETRRIKSRLLREE